MNQLSINITWCQLASKFFIALSVLIGVSLISLPSLYSQKDQISSERSFRFYHVSIANQENLVQYMIRLESRTKQANAFDFKEIEELNPQVIVTDQIAEPKSDSIRSYYFKLVNDTESTFNGFIYFDNSGLDSLNLFTRSSEDSTKLSFSEKTPIKNRLVRHSNCVFPIIISSNDTLQCLLEIAHFNIPINTSVKLYRQNDFVDKEIRFKLILGSYIGLQILVLMMMPLLIYFKRNYRLIISLFIYQVVLFLTVLDFYGLLLPYFFPQFTYLEKHITIFLYITCFYCFYVFTSILFQDRSLDKIKLLLSIVYLSSILPIIFKELPQFYFENIFYIVVGSIILYISLSIWIVIMNGPKNKMLTIVYGLGTSLLVVAVVSRLIFYLTQQPTTFYSLYGFLFGAFMETLVYFLLISYLIVSGNKKYLQQLSENKIAELRLEKKLLSERNRISQELHDDLGSGLTTINYLTYKAKNQEDEKQIQILNSISKESGKLIASLSEIIWLMKSSDQDINDFIPKLRQLVISYFDNFSIEGVFEFESNDEKNYVLTSFQKRNIYLIMKESLHNIIKHSKATKATVRIKILNHTLNINIIDEGIGLGHNFQFGNGFINFRSRAEKLNGSFSYDSNNGLRLTFSIPINPSL